MESSRRNFLSATGAIALGAATPMTHARAQGAANTIRIGVLTDMSGPFRDISGPTSVVATRTAVQDFGSRGFNVEVLVADHQNRPDVGVNLVRQWIDRDGVDMVVDVPSSGVALAVNTVMRERNKVYLNSTAATVELTGAQCSPNTIHWTYDTWMLARSTGAALVRAGGQRWFFITADYAFGHSLEAQTMEFVRSAGGTVVGSVRHPFPGTTDYSSFLLQAQASRAQIVGIANAGVDAINAIKQAGEFGLMRRGQRVAGLLVFVNDVNSLGLQTAGGSVLTETFYWDLNDRTRAVTQRVLANGSPGGNRPSMGHAGCYSATLHYLKAVADMGAAAAKADGRAVIERMKAMPTDDDAFGQGSIRPDGRKLHPAYLFQVKTPQESRGPWDFYTLLQTTSPEEAFRPMAQGNCPLVRT
ncbi:MAG: ABC transporter substrate-binding protein [Acetobacteraceae bacterium]|nr:ABC transporter substrate-binding protein [Acetobacteraceae bacterium]